MRRNNGAPGNDKTTLADVEEYGVSRLLGELASELLVPASWGSWIWTWYLLMIHAMPPRLSLAWCWP